jgi:periplasmic protein TonB
MRFTSIFSFVLLSSVFSLWLQPANADVVLMDPWDGRPEPVLVAKEKVSIEPLCAEPDQYRGCADEAKPKWPPANWFTAYDYPSQSARTNQSGAVAVKLSIDPASGRVNDCAVTNSSGFELLDTASCLHLRRRARFLPRPDATGKSPVLYFRARVVWIAAWSEAR